MNRQGFIGGSDAVKIMQGDWYDLWMVKTGRAQPADLSDNIAVQLGTWTESFNLNWFEKEHKCVLGNHQYEFEKNQGSIPIKGTVDAMWNGSIVEAKHTNAFSNMGEVIERYMPQIQLYCWLANADGAYLSVIFGNSKWESCHVKFDQAYLKGMMTVIADFWRHVVDDKEPIGVSVDAPSIMSIPIDDMVVRDASHDNMFVDAAVTYIQGYEQNRVFENAKKDLKNMIASNEREVFCEYLTIKRDKRGALRISKRK